MKRYAEWAINSVDKLRTRLSVKLFLGTFLMLLALFWASFGIARTLIPELYIRQFSTRFEAFVVDFGDEISELTLNEVKTAIDLFAAYNNAHVTLTTVDENEVIYTVNAMTIMDTTSPLIEASRIFRRDPMTGTRFVITAQTHLDSIIQIREILEQIFRYLLIGNLFISLIASYLFSTSISDPIVKLTKRAKKFEQLDLTDPHKITRADEIGILATHLNQMATKLDKTLTDLQIANTKLQKDINLKQQQEQQRTQLFTALSHELKTPLVILKGEIEGMIKNIGAYSDRETYLKKSYKTAETMELLIQEILLVSRLETNEIKLNQTHLNIGELINSICQNYEGLANLKHVSLLYYCEENLITKADKFQLQNAIANIINNAIFHSSAHEIVWIELTKQANSAVLTVKNKGEIAEAEMPHLFEPFYRLDKSRNRHSGGSGLGLFIVKNILDLHQFEYKLTNEGEFVVFTVDFPLKKEEVTEDV